MERHPIESLMETTMENIKDMVDVNTVIGDPVATQDGNTVIPISRVCFGFVAGGGEYGAEERAGAQGAAAEPRPFAGGSGAGVSVHPMGFLVVGNGQVKLLSANYITPLDRVMELAPQVISDLKEVFCKEEPKPRAKEQKTEAAGAYPSPYPPAPSGFNPPPYVP
ncbi:MAG: GerW family sporulation protein [Clostridia bacterium]|nr:GerW family sporulation protein [Clostridia bacterium]